jgi:hypothetical protein
MSRPGLIGLADGPRGAFGCLVRVQGAEYILTSGHVLDPDGRQATVGRLVRDRGTIEAGGQVIGTVADAAYNTDYGLDVALAEPSSRFDPHIPHLGAPEGINVRLVEGMTVSIYSARSGAVRKGSIRTASDGLRRLRCSNGQVREYLGLVFCSSYSMDGDSGAAVLDRNNSLLGIHVGGNQSDSWFTPCQSILHRYPSLKVVASR